MKSQQAASLVAEQTETIHEQNEKYSQALERNEKQEQHTNTENKKEVEDSIKTSPSWDDYSSDSEIQPFIFNAEEWLSALSLEDKHSEDSELKETRKCRTKENFSKEVGSTVEKVGVSKVYEGTGKERTPKDDLKREAHGSQSKREDCCTENGLSKGTSHSGALSTEANRHVVESSSQVSKTSKKNMWKDEWLNGAVKAFEFCLVRQEKNLKDIKDILRLPGVLFIDINKSKLVAAYHSIEKVSSSRFFKGRDITKCCFSAQRSIQRLPVDWPVIVVPIYEATEESQKTYRERCPPSERPRKSVVVAQRLIFRSLGLSNANLKQRTS
eukprot:jgi/Galph1/734/GphlegSOOS_G5568.1